MFGDVGQEILRGLTVAVVGAGGGGSLLVEMLAHLGVGKLIIVDYDVISKSNLSRVVGSTCDDVGRLKVDVMRELVTRIDPEIDVHASTRPAGASGDRPDGRAKAAPDEPRRARRWSGSIRRARRSEDRRPPNSVVLGLGHLPW
jgi:ThiF family